MIAADNSFHFDGGPVAVLLVHGLTGTPVEMRGLGKALARSGCTVHGVQLAGHCGSESDLVATGWRDWHASVLEALDRMRERHRQVFVGGLSLGALLALTAAAERPRDVAGVLLYSTTIFHDGWAMPRLRLLADVGLALGLGRWWRFAERHPFGIKDERLRERVVAAMLGGDSAAAGNASTPGLSLRELNRMIRVVKRCLPEIRTPALVVHARDDDMTSLRNADYVAARIGGEVEKVILEDSYHMVTLDREREKVALRTLDFIERVGRGTASPRLRLVAGGAGR
jgi:carboxylesterase